MKQYAKAIVAFITTTCGVVATALADGHVSQIEIALGISTITVATAGVFGIRNDIAVPEEIETVDA